MISFLATLVVVAGVVPTINIKTDYHRVLHRDYHYLYKVRRENTGFLKVAYLIDHPFEFDSIIFGSSRVGHGINVASLSDNLGGKWFKLSYPGGVPYQHYHNLKALVANGFTPKKVIVAMNDFDTWATKGDERYNKNYNRRLYPSGFLDFLKFYSFYLFKKPGKAEFDILTGKIQLITNYRIVGEVHGFSASKNSDEKKRKKSLIARKAYHWRRADWKYNYGESLDYMGRIVTLCREKSIELFLVNLPTPLKNLSARNFASLDSYKNELVKLHDFYDFSGSYSVVNRPQYWFEHNHFGRSLGSKMIEVLAREKKAPGRFGSYVTTGNITKHLSLVREGVVDDLPALLLENKNAVVSESLLTRVKELPGDLLSSIFLSESDGATLTLKIPKKQLNEDHYVLRLDLRALTNTSFRAMVKRKQLIRKRLGTVEKRIYCYVSSMDLTHGIDFILDSNKIDYSSSKIELFSL